MNYQDFQSLYILVLFIHVSYCTYLSCNKGLRVPLHHIAHIDGNTTLMVIMLHHQFQNTEIHMFLIL